MWPTDWLVWIRGGGVKTIAGARAATLGVEAFLKHGIKVRALQDFHAAMKK